jgi:tetratricopeptide (TPR) repeat protein
VTGLAGTGKTRLVTQFALTRPAPWVCGWLSGGRGADAVAVIRACGDPALVLVDEADQRPDLAALLASAKADRDAGTAVRVILVSRGAGFDARVRVMLDGVPKLPLGPFGGADDRARWFGEAVRAYARARQVPPPDLPDHLSGYVTDPAEPILALHAQALLAVLDSERSRPMIPPAEGLPFDRVAAALFAHEQYRWETSVRQPKFGLTDLTSPSQAQAIAVLLLASPADHAQAVAVLGRLPELATASAERRANIARWAGHLYPGDPPWPIQLKPDMLAEWFVVTQLTQTPDLAGLSLAMTPARQATLLVLFARASDHMPAAVQLFTNIIAADTPRLAEAGVAAALTASTGRRRLDGALASLIGQVTWSADALGRVEDQLTAALPQTRAATAEARVQIVRKDGHAAELAGALRNLGLRLYDLSRYREALAAADEAVRLLRALARDDSDYQTDLGHTLDDLGIYLDRLGRNEEALAAAEEAVALLRAHVRDYPTHQHELAKALDDLGNRLGDLGRNQEALAATEEAVPLLRALARDNPAHQPTLAKALDNRGIHLAGPGRYQEALADGEEAVRLWRALVRDNPAYRPQLAIALNNLGICLFRLGRYREALAAAGKAFRLSRAIVRDHPAHRPHCAIALINFGNHLAHLGRARPALSAAQGAVALWRDLADDNPAYKPKLASALMDLGNRLADLGRDEQALAAADEAVGLWRALAQDNPDEYREIHNRELARLRRDLESHGRRKASILLHLDDSSRHPGKPRDDAPNLSPPEL